MEPSFPVKNLIAMLGSQNKILRQGGIYFLMILEPSSSVDFF